jgi:hypothetical protein
MHGTTSEKRLIVESDRKRPGAPAEKISLRSQETYMNTRFVTWTIVATCSMAVAACGSDSPSILTAPTVSTSPPAPPPPRSLAVDLTGNYALTFEVGSACDEVPKELRTRTYEARIGYYKSVGSADWFRAELSGAEVHSYQPVVIEVSGNSVSVDLSDNFIVDEPSPGAYLATAGYGVASVQPTESPTISGSFKGSFKYCAATSGTGAPNQCSVYAMVRGMCRSEDSRWTLTRR